MSCPTCDHTMSHLGQTIDGPSRRDLWWCPRCGTIRVDGFGSFDEMPKLVERCRKFYGRWAEVDKVYDDMQRIGVRESIYPPESRS